MAELTLSDLQKIKTVGRATVLTPEKKEIIHDMVREGSTISKIAKAVGAPYQYVYNYLNRLRAKLEKEKEEDEG